MMDDPFRNAIRGALSPLVELDSGALSNLITEPPPPKVDRAARKGGKTRKSRGQKVRLADLSLPCFRLTSAFPGMNPPQIAAHLADRMEHPPAGVSEVVANGPYLNFFFDPVALARHVLDGRPAERGEGTGRTVLVEYSSPNIAKPFHIGHMRTTVLGESLARILEQQGHQVVRLNHLGDWGVQTGLQVIAWELWGDEEELARGGIRYLCDLYVRINARAREDPSVGERAREIFKKLEDGDEKVRGVWRRFVQVTLEELKRSYARLGIRFDRYDGESFYESRIPGVIQELRQRGLLRESQGAKVVDVPGLEEPCIIIKADGATIYQTRDVAAALYRHETWPGLARCLYVVAANQEFHFQQVFGVFERMRPEAQGRLVHVKFGLVRDSQGKIYSTRGGATARLDDILDEARDRALDLVRQKSGSLDDEQSVAEAVGHAALAYEFLRRSPNRDVKFVFEEASRPEGDTGPYLQYTHARCCSIIAECGQEVPHSWDPAYLEGPEEMEVLKALWRLPGAIDRSADPERDVYDTSILASALMDLARAFGSFYTAPAEQGQERRYRYPVRDAPAGVRQARLRLVAGVRDALAMGLALLTIETPGRM